MRFTIISAHRAEYPVTMMCRVLGVSTSGFYAWLSRPPSPRTKEDKVLRARLKAARERSNGTYGSPRLVLELVDEGSKWDGNASRG